MIHFRVLDRLQVTARWSSASTILTLMAWRSNILQKSFVRDCSSLLKNDWRFTRRWQSLQLAIACCVFCSLLMCYQKCLNFAVLKVLPSGSLLRSLRPQFLISLVDVVRLLFLKQHRDLDPELVLSDFFFLSKILRFIRFILILDPSDFGF